MVDVFVLELFETLILSGLDPFDLIIFVKSRKPA